MSKHEVFISWASNVFKKLTFHCHFLFPPFSHLLQCRPHHNTNLGQNNLEGTILHRAIFYQVNVVFVKCNSNSVSCFWVNS
jgi:hypothetical protein